jgi:iron uptake system EfeUOB component EfeO/EfeM
MNKDLEYNFIVSYREGYGWYANAELEKALFDDASIYNYTDTEWVRLLDLPDEIKEVVEGLDLSHYTMLLSAIRLLNEGAINA